MFICNKFLCLLFIVDFLYGFWMGVVIGFFVFFIEYVLGNLGFVVILLFVFMVSNLIVVLIWV